MHGSLSAFSVQDYVILANFGGLNFGLPAAESRRFQKYTKTARQPVNYSLARF